MKRQQTLFDVFKKKPKLKNERQKPESSETDAHSPTSSSVTDIEIF
jgi:hypothetical protein